MSEVVDGPRIRGHEGGQHDRMPAPELPGSEKTVASNTGGKGTGDGILTHETRSTFHKVFVFSSILIPSIFFRPSLFSVSILPTGIK